MTDRTERRQEAYPSMGITEVILRTGTTVTGATDTLTMTLADYGINRVLYVFGNVHTTDYSVMVEDDGTTAVASGVLTITTETGNNNKRRVYVVGGE
jgi:hypothetical protein